MRVFNWKAVEELTQRAGAAFAWLEIDEAGLNPGYEFVGIDAGQHYHVIQRPDQIIWGVRFTPGVTRKQINEDDAIALQEAGLQLIDVDINTLRPKDSSRRGHDGQGQTRYEAG